MEYRDLGREPGGVQLMGWPTVMCIRWIPSLSV
jgi:hypothetical protein